MTYCKDPNFSTTQLLLEDKAGIFDKKNSEKESAFKSFQFRQGIKEGGLRLQGFFKKSFVKKPLISIITVTLNSQRYLEDTILSVLNQSYNNIEYIIIDGGSTDATIDIIKKHESKIDYWISEKDGGIYHAMNKGISLASGSIIGIINSDDWLKLNAIKSIADRSNQITGPNFVIHGKIATFDAKGNLVGERKPNIFPHYYLFSTPFKHPAMFASKNLYAKIGMYNDNCGLAADYDWMLRVVNNNIRTSFINQVLTNVRLVGISTGGNSNASYKELLDILERNTGSKIKASLGILGRIFKNYLG